MKAKDFFEDIYPDTFLIGAVLIYIALNWKNDSAHIIGMSLSLVSCVFWIIARINLGKSFAMQAQAKALVTHGIYSKIRNPMYVFSTLIILGILIILQKFYLYPILLLLILLQIYRAKKEGQILQATFGEKYLEYKRSTWF